MEGALIRDLRAIVGWQGRAPRRQYWLAVGVATVSTVLGVAITIATFAAGAEALGFIIGMPVLLAGLLPLGMTTMRRLRDRNRPPIWILLIVAPSMVGSLADVLGVEGGARFAMVMMIGAPAWIWSVVELGVLRGTVGRNRYGDDPLQPSSAEVFS